MELSRPETRLTRANDSAGAGAGKTILASIVIDKLEALAREWGNQLCVAYVYIRYSDQDQPTVGGILECLVKQTVERHPDCMPLTQQTYARHLQEGTRPTEGELLRLLSQFAEKRKATFYVLNALDEAPVKIRLKLIQKLLSLGVRLFVTSRPLPTLEAKFPAAHTFSIFAQDHDLDLHIAEKIDGCEDLQDLLQRGGPEFKDHLIMTVKVKCGGMFLHASLQLDALQQCFTVHDAIQTLEAFPQRIEDVYQQTWERIIRSEPRQSSLAKAAFVWILNARQTMTIDQLCRALATSPETHRFESSRLMPEAALVSACHGLITVDKESRLARLIHYTAKDRLDNLLPTSFLHPHSILAAVCIARLTDCGFQNTSIDSREELDRALDADPLLAYAYGAWAFHAQQPLHLDFIVSRMSQFIAGCRTFPHTSGLDVFSDDFRPLHFVGFYNLPIALAEPRDAQDTNLRTARARMTPLHLACLLGHHAAARSLLSLPDILVNVRDRNGQTALMLACRKGHEGIVRLLLAHPSIDVNLVCEYKKSALMLASLFGDEATIKLLLARPHIEVNPADNGGDTPLIVASVGGHTSTVQLLLAHPCVDINLTNRSGETALMVVTRSWLFPNDDNRGIIVKCLLAHPKVKVNLAGLDGSTALVLASHYGRIGAVRHLLAAPDIDVNPVDSNGDTAIRKAAEEGHEEIVQMLLEDPGINISVRSTDGHTAISAAVFKGHHAIVRLLEEFETRNAARPSSSQGKPLNTPVLAQPEAQASEKTQSLFGVPTDFARDGGVDSDSGESLSEFESDESDLYEDALESL